MKIAPVFVWAEISDVRQFPHGWKKEMSPLECSVWNSGGSGWGLKVLGGSSACTRYFRREQSPVHIELDGYLFPVNIDKESFWTGDCRELISTALRDWIARHQLKTGDRVWLGVVIPYHTFKALLAAPKFSPQAAA